MCFFGHNCYQISRDISSILFWQKCLSLRIQSYFLTSSSQFRITSLSSKYVKWPPEMRRRYGLLLNCCCLRKVNHGGSLWLTTSSRSVQGVYVILYTILSHVGLPWGFSTPCMGQLSSGTGRSADQMVKWLLWLMHEGVQFDTIDTGVIWGHQETTSRPL